MTIDERMEFLMQSIESHDRQIGALTSQIAEVIESIAKLVMVSNEDATSIRTLADIVKARENRISGLEEGR